MIRRRGFALVMALLLVVLLAATGTGLALTGASESVMAGWVAADLHHRLALESFVRFVPALVAHRAEDKSGGDPMNGRYMELAFADYRVRCRMRQESKKTPLRTVRSQTVDQLRELARQNSLPTAGIRVRPIAETEASPLSGRLLWFDQIVRPRGFQEVFPWHVEPPENKPPHGKTWSDLVTFWNGAGGEVMTLHVETVVGTDARRWYVIARVDGDRTEVLFRCSVP